MYVTGVATQGRYGGGSYVMSYYLMYLDPYQSPDEWIDVKVRNYRVWVWVLCHVVVVMVLWIEDGCGQEISKHTALSGFIYFELQQFKLSHSVKLVSQSLAFSLALYSLTQSLNHSATQSVSQLNLPMFFNCQSSIQFNFSIDFQLIVNHCL